MVDERFTDQWNLELGDPIDVQNDLAAVYGLPDIFEQIETIQDYSAVNFETDIDGEYYAYVGNPKVDEVEFTYDDGNNTKSFKNVKRHYILELGYLEGEKSGRIVNTDGDDSIDTRVYRINYDSLKKLYYILNKNPLYLTYISDTKLVGNVHTVEGTTLFTTIPYEEGWSVYVDGQKEEKIKLLGAFIGVELEKGQHEIEFKYLSSGTFSGILISVFSLAILLLIYLFIKVKNNDFKLFKLKKEQGLREDEIEEIDLDSVNTTNDGDEAKEIDNSNIETNEEANDTNSQNETVDNKTVD
jgi:putative membrane protein (fragment)